MWGRRPRFIFYLAQWYWDSYPFSRRVRHRPLMKHWIPCASRGVKGMWGPLSRWGGNLCLSLGSEQGIQICLHFLTWKTSLNLSHCREIVASFESGPLGVHSTWDRKHRVPLTSLLLRENSSWGACGKLAHLFSQRQGISSHLCWHHATSVRQTQGLGQTSGCHCRQADYFSKCQTGKTPTTISSPDTTFFANTTKPPHHSRKDYKFALTGRYIQKRIFRCKS